MYFSSVPNVIFFYGVPCNIEVIWDLPSFDRVGKPCGTTVDLRFTAPALRSHKKFLTKWEAGSRSFTWNIFYFCGNLILNILDLEQAEFILSYH